MRLNAALDLDAAPVNLGAPGAVVLPAGFVGVIVAKVVCAPAGVAVAGAVVPGTRPTELPATVVKMTCGTVTALEMTVAVEAGPLLWVHGT
jgi:hypothetical protein